MTSELDQLEILELLGKGINKDEALKLSQLPTLQTVNLSDSLQRVTGHNTEAPSKPPWVPICECMPSEAAQQLVDLREVAPHINWVVKGLGCCDEKPASPPNSYDWY